MKTLLVGFIVGVMVGAQPLECSYENGVFKVKDGGKTYQQKIAFAKTFQSSCGENRAAIYDGLDLTVFNRDTKKFEWEGVRKDQNRTELLISGRLVSFYDGQNFVIHSSRFASTPVKDYLYAKMESSAETAVLYDGFDFIVYQTGRDNFRRWGVRSKSPYARVTAFGKIGAIYDGSEFLVCDGIADRALHRSVKNSVTTMLLAGKASAIHYEGTTLTAYCSKVGAFKIHVTGKKDWSNAQYDAVNDRFEFELDRKRHVIDGTNCDLKTF